MCTRTNGALVMCSALCSSCSAGARVSRVSHVMRLLLLAACLADAYSSECPAHCHCLFGQYSCSGGTLLLRRRDTSLTIVCEDSNVVCSDLPKIDVQLNRLTFYKCPSSILTCIGDPLTLDQPWIRQIDVAYMRNPLSNEHISNLKYLKTLRMYFDADTPIPISLINSLNYLKNLYLFGGQLQLSTDRFNNTSLEELYSERVNMGSFEAPVFNGLSGLKHLLISKVKIQHISADSFRGLTSLKRLTMLRNNLNSIQVGAFSSTPNLRSLNIIENPLESLPNHWTGGMETLQEVFIKCPDTTGLNVTELNLGSHAFSQLPALSSVIVENCIVHDITGDLYNGSNHIVTTSMTGNRINHLPPNMFKNLSSLKSLAFSVNNISELANGLLANLTSLESIYLVFNKIEKLPEGVFATLTSLKSLYLSHNYIQALHDGMFSHLKTLIVLDLSYNFIQDLTLDVFVGLDYLTTLYLQNNTIMTIEVSTDVRRTFSPFRYLAQLHTLDLSNNQIRRLCNCLTWEMPHIRLLNLANNRFKDILDFIFNFMKRNIEIDLSDNDISEIDLKPIGVPRNGSQPSHSALLLHRNPIFCDCKNYALFLRARGLGLPHEPHFTLGSTTCIGPSNLTGKHVVNLSPTDLVCDLHNMCPYNCSCILRPATNEVLVECHKIPATFHIEKLMDYALQYNSGFINLNLRYQPTSLENLNINTLNLSNAALDNVSFVPNDHLKILDLSYNNLLTVPDVLLESNITLYVSKNPLTCDCTLAKELKEYRVADYKLVECADGTKLSQINVHRVCGWNISLLGYICMGIIATIFLIKIVTTVKRHLKRIRRLRNISRILFKRGSDYSIQLETRLDTGKQYDLFISFAHADSEFVRDNLLPKLENEFDQKVCVHHRDWIAGELIADQIVRSVESARRTVIVLTEDFISSEWSYLEFRTAHNMSIREGKPRVIMILLKEDIVNDERLTRDIKSYICINTYLLWSDPDFWKKFKRILPNQGRK